MEHEAVAEAAVVGHPHPVKGECLYCFVTLCDGHTFSPTLTEELKKQSKELPGTGTEGSASYWGEAAADYRFQCRVGRLVSSHLVSTSLYTGTVTAEFQGTLPVSAPGSALYCFIPFNSCNYLHEIDPVVMLVVKMKKLQVQRSYTACSRLCCQV